ncbi:autotransporter-associated beta strand repeat-containing protein, partial [Acinetobacter baumannii]
GTTLGFANTGNYAIANAITVSGDATFLASAGTAQTLSGIISDATGGAPAGAVVVNGGGTLVLSGANTYSGGTTLSQGTLVVRGASVFTNVNIP